MFPRQADDGVRVVQVVRERFVDKGRHSFFQSGPGQFQVVGAVVIAVGHQNEVYVVRDFVNMFANLRSGGEDPRKDIGDTGMFVPYASDFEFVQARNRHAGGVAVECIKIEVRPAAHPGVWRAGAVIHGFLKSQGRMVGHQRAIIHTVHIAADQSDTYFFHRNSPGRHHHENTRRRIQEPPCGTEGEKYEKKLTGTRSFCLNTEHMFSIFWCTGEQHIPAGRVINSQSVGLLQFSEGHRCLPERTKVVLRVKTDRLNTTSERSIDIRGSIRTKSGPSLPGSRQGDEAAIAALVNANLRFVIHIARGYQNQGLPLGDLINEGNCGLFTAARKFDRSKGCRFITYAVWWIRQHILKALDVQTRTVRVPASVLNDIGRLRKTEDRLMQRLERSPALEEVAAQSGLPLKRLNRCLDGGASAVSLDSDGAEGRLSLRETLSDRRLASAEETLVEACRTRAVEETLDLLSERHRKILSLYFGMHGEEPTTYQEIGRRLGSAGNG